MINWGFRYVLANCRGLYYCKVVEFSCYRFDIIDGIDIFNMTYI
jgi:hypothetical protein